MDYLRNTIEKTPTHTALAMSASVSALGLAWLVNDYRAWVSFGTGGTPPNVQGYLKVTKFRLQRAWSGDSLTDVTKLSSQGPSYLPSPLPSRQGPAPRMMSRTLPQRQRPAPLADDISKRLHALPSKYVKAHPDLLILDKSITEGRSTDAIYANPELPGRKQATHDKILGDEIAHVHPAENSLHVWLTQADARKVIQAGWGQRFPLASLGILDEGWVFVYAPRTMAEVDVVETIVRAGIAHLTGISV